MKIFGIKISLDLVFGLVATLGICAIFLMLNKISHNKVIKEVGIDRRDACIKSIRVCEFKETIEEIKTCTQYALNNICVPEEKEEIIEDSK